MSMTWSRKGLAVFASEGTLAAPIARVMPGPQAEFFARLIAAAPALEIALLDVLIAGLRRTVEHDPAEATQPAPAEVLRAVHLLVSINGWRTAANDPTPDPGPGEAA